MSETKTLEDFEQWKPGDRWDIDDLEAYVPRLQAEVKRLTERQRESSLAMLAGIQRIADRDAEITELRARLNSVCAEAHRVAEARDVYDLLMCDFAERIKIKTCGPYRPNETGDDPAGPGSCPRCAGQGVTPEATG